MIKAVGLLFFKSKFEMHWYDESGPWVCGYVCPVSLSQQPPHLDPWFFDSKETNVIPFRSNNFCISNQKDLNYIDMGRGNGAKKTSKGNNSWQNRRIYTNFISLERSRLYGFKNVYFCWGPTKTLDAREKIRHVTRVCMCLSVCLSVPYHYPSNHGTYKHEIWTAKRKK